jgi:hypothetical protein
MDYFVFSDFGSPLHVAAFNGHLEVAQFLVYEGADVNTTNE